MAHNEAQLGASREVALAADSRYSFDESSLLKESQGNYYNSVDSSELPTPPWAKGGKLHRFELLFNQLMYYLPNILSHSMFFFVLGVYYVTYLHHLIFDSPLNKYSYPYLWKTEGEREDERVKGAIYLVLLIWFSFWFYTSLLQCTYQEPGYIPEEKEWDLEFYEEDDFSSKNARDQQIKAAANRASKEFRTRRRYDEGGQGVQGAGAGRVRRSASILNTLNNEEGPIMTSLLHQGPAPVEGEKKKLVRKTAAIQIERKKYGGIRMCNRCLKSKPDRCHHCSVCSRCILKMDHHCPWIANCVGFANYKYFMNLLLYTALASGLVSITYFDFIRMAILRSDFSELQLYLMLLAFSLSSVLSVIITGFFFFHISLIMTAYTTIEYCEKKKSGNLEFQRSPYNLGRWKNFLNVFGNNPLFWFVPFKTVKTGEGLIFEVSAEVKKQYHDQLTIQDGISS